jgi:hypothetical protein
MKPAKLPVAKSNAATPPSAVQYSRFKRQHAVVAAIHIDQTAERVNSQTARVGNARIGTERSEKLAVPTKRQQRAVPVSVGSAGTRHEDGHERSP